MKLTILGTGNAMAKECFNTCFALSDEKGHFLVDAGGGNRILKALSDAQIPMEDIHDMFITHEHVDHLLGAIWVIRVVATKMNQGKYEGVFRIYCHKDLVNTIQTISNLTLQKKMCAHFGERILFVPLEHGDCESILGCQTTFFDIFSTKAKQFGFTMELPGQVKFTCLGDEPYNEKNQEYVQGSEWLMHEAFCLYGESHIFKPYEKHHSTVREASQLAENLQIPNLILYHAEETHLHNRKELYTAEGKEYYKGNLYVPYDMEIFFLS